MIPFEDYDEVREEGDALITAVAIGAACLATGAAVAAVLAGCALRWLGRQVVRNGL